MTDTTTRDIVELLNEDHQEAKRLLEEITQADAVSREALFWKLVPALVQHEVAEEVVVYPVIRDKAPNGAAEVDARLTEQAEAEIRLAQMERLDPATTEFASELKGLREDVLEHAQAEEDGIFPLLGTLESPADRAKLGARYEKAKASAPTHPHPNAPDTPPGNRVVGPIAALFDKTRDALRNL